MDTAALTADVADADAVVAGAAWAGTAAKPVSPMTTARAAEAARSGRLVNDAPVVPVEDRSGAEEVVFLDDEERKSVEIMKVVSDF